ncbi:MAG: IreB family regulatory phosphoprotein [Christensenellaceae bacterium]|jgi:uncharacterized protein (UPF0297 family)|nr:IreB family regulatory phosphoprotein [Christensenellaceae bacterium]
MSEQFNDTQRFKIGNIEALNAHDILMKVYDALKQKGYDPVNQIVGYLISGDPTYITSFGNARYLIRQLERDELIEELVKSYVTDQDV